jgi:hypothetical protein
MFVQAVNTRKRCRYRHQCRSFAILHALPDPREQATGSRRYDRNVSEFDIETFQTDGTVNAARLGRRSRELLAEATAGTTQVAQWTFTEVALQARRRAAHALARMGLVVLTKLPGLDAVGSRQKRLLHLDLTDLGRRVVETFRRELAEGRQIRWGKLAL